MDRKHMKEYQSVRNFKPFFQKVKFLYKNYIFKISQKYIL